MTAPLVIGISGASGIVYGRNVIQHPNPKGITQALMAMVHKNATVDQALEIVAQP